MWPNPEFKNKFPHQNLLIVSIVLVVAVLIGVYTTLDLQKTPKVKSRAKEASQIEFLSPKNNQKVSGTIGIVAKATLKRDSNNLVAIYRVDEQEVKPLTIKKTDNKNFVLRTTLNTNTLLSGNHKMNIYIYDYSNNALNQIGSSSIDITSIK